MSVRLLEASKFTPTWIGAGPSKVLGVLVWFPLKCFFESKLFQLETYLSKVLGVLAEVGVGPYCAAAAAY